MVDAGGRSGALIDLRPFGRKEVLLPPYNRAYGNSCFETEAIYNQHDPLYTRRWWRHLFAWITYIPNRKYPYIPPEKTTADDEELIHNMGA